MDEAAALEDLRLALYQLNAFAYEERDHRRQHGEHAMGKRDIDRRVADALKALTATKEDSIRDLAAALDKIEAVDGKITALNKTRNELIAPPTKKAKRPRRAGWKVRELSDAGLVVPRATARPPAKRRDPRPQRQPRTIS